MSANVKSCPNCRARVDPTFTTHCPECGTSLSPGVESMTVPESNAADTAPRGGGFTSFLTGIGIRVAVAALAVGIGAAYTAFTTTDRDDTGAVTDEGTIDAFALAVGDCIMWPGSGDGYEFGEVTALPCSESHDAEVYALVDYPATSDEDYPGKDPVDEWSIDACYAAFTGYVGRSYEEADELDFTFFTPTETGWGKHDDRTVQCVIHRLDDAPMTASVRAGA